MNRSCHSLLLLLLFLLSFLAFISSAYTKDVAEEVGMSFAVQKYKHKHSGFSQAECPGACKFRCSKTQYKKPCLFFCQKCCFKCKCVPPGTYAHKEVCPCYNNWKTKSGGPKCP
ncbi:gibberellin-regulated protein 12-like [Dioscorea cayenensis subsp. rotundata]|uniref:Gibberellin-regulated protein 12-like n=1 Tax=Dioscorea cayennensis subsp. rotundata TaxID=55577 RepID=A0AB40BZ62_DIOCR|nr:gibberellin-regulated protein 12-like [Dioscorea cayenensis subsp. rotundata]